MIKYWTKRNELDNLRDNLLKKMAQLNVKLPEFAKIINIKYMTLRRFMYDDTIENPLYFQTTWQPIADYFNVQISDLLGSPNLPQYIPVINVNEVQSFINNPQQFKDNKMILSEKFVHKNGFAINIENNNENVPYKLSTYIIKPDNKIIIGYTSIFKYNDKLTLGKLQNISNSKLIIKDFENNIMLDIPGNDTNVIGNAVRIIVDQELSQIVA
jgi:hypothetical protein